MSPFILADTGPLFALADPDDQYSEQATQAMAAIRASAAQVYVIHPTVLEAYSLLMRQLGVHSAQRWIQMLRLTTGLIPVSTPYYEEAFALILAYPDQDITLFDALLHIVSLRSAIPIWSFDHHFDILGSSRWYP